MNKEEAKAILTTHLERYRGRRYTELQRLLGTQDTFESRGDSGSVYQLEFLAVWDDRPNGNLRVFGSIDDSGLRAFFPLTECLIVAPNGTFVGEGDGA